MLFFTSLYANVERAVGCQKCPLSYICDNRGLRTNFNLFNRLVYFNL
jgi:hypothetical protein